MCNFPLSALFCVTLYYVFFANTEWFIRKEHFSHWNSHCVLTHVNWRHVTWSLMCFADVSSPLLEFIKPETLARTGVPIQHCSPSKRELWYKSDTNLFWFKLCNLFSPLVLWLPVCLLFFQSPYTICCWIIQGRSNHIKLTQKDIKEKNSLSWQIRSLFSSGGE